MFAAEFRADELEVIAGRPLAGKDEGVILPGGLRRSILTTKVPLPDGRGAIRGLVGIGRDMTERRRGERRLAAQYAVTRVLSESTSLPEAAPGLMRAICETLEAAYGALWEIDRQARVLRATATFFRHEVGADEVDELTRRTTFAPGEGLPGRVWDGGQPLLTTPFDADAFPRAADAARAGLISAFAFPIVVGTEVAAVLEFLGAEVHAPDPDLLDLLKALGTQIGQFVEHRRADAMFVQAQKMEAVGQLAGGIAHDFNNLLGVILGYVDLARVGLSAGHPSRPRLDAIQKAAERAAALTRHILTFSRRQAVVPRVCDLNEIVEGMEPLLRRLIGEDVRLAVVLGATLGRVRADPGQVEQVIMNLAVNARDAMPRGGRVVIETSNVELDASAPRTQTELRPGPHVLLAVSDTGEGMSPETQARIFEPFFTTKAQGKGTGLGLAVVYGVVKQSGGSISVYSEPGHGTTFKVYLPRVDEAATTAQEDRPGEAAGGTETVLLVEDEDALRAVSAEVLRGAGYHVLEAEDTTAAVVVAGEADRPIDLVISDVVLPDGTGPDLAARILAGHTGARVLLVSGYTDGLVRGAAGAETPFLGKPFSIDALLRKVREVLDAPGA
jgi:signal transduction histidine kinase